MLQMDRGDFWTRRDDQGRPYEFDPESYQDKPQGINFNVVISAPHLHAHILECLSDRLMPGAKVLDVGSGTGILCAAFYEFTKTNQIQTTVVGIEHIHELAQSSFNNLSKTYV